MGDLFGATPELPYEERKRRVIASHSLIRLICFNGSKAEALFGKLVSPQLPGKDSMRFETLPSTSPANASMSYPDKLRRWSIVRDATVD
jgi:TDG/mug DNA glycosylase family protein